MRAAQPLFLPGTLPGNQAQAGSGGLRFRNTEDGQGRVAGGNPWRDLTWSPGICLQLGVWEEVLSPSQWLEYQPE